MSGTTAPVGVVMGDATRGWTDPRLPVVTLLFGAIVGVLAELALLNAGSPADAIATDAASGFAFVLAGTAAWRLRPGNRVGPAMTGIGLAWFGGDFLFAPVPLIGPLSFGAQAAARILFAWLLLAFPSGRLESDLHRWAVGLVAAMAIGLAAVQFVTLDPATLCPCPASPFAVASGSPLADQLPNLSALVGIGLTAIAVPLAVRRLLVASPAARRTLLPVLAGGLFSLLSVTPTLAHELGGIELPPLTWLPVVWIALPVGFLVALLNARFARGAVADLVVRLGDTPEPARLREALAAALHDPTLEVAHWSAEAASYIRPGGQPVELPGAASGRAVTLLESDRGPLAAIIHDPALSDDPGLVASVGAAVRLAVENERLQAEVEAQLAEVRASRARIVSAGDAERRRVERNLHDGAQQRLVALSLALRRARAQLPSDAEPETAATLDEAADQLRAALEELRTLARGIHPAILTEAGLGSALRALARDSAVPVEVELELPDRLPDAVEAAAYFVAAEALANVAKYADASRVHVRATVADGRLTLEVRDDGRGGADPHAGSGLRGLADRVAALAGELVVESEVGRGTAVVARIPAGAVPSHEAGPA